MTRIGICLYSYEKYENYKLKCYTVKTESLPILVSHINVVNRTGAYNI